MLDEFVAEAMEAVKRSIEPASSWPEAVHLAVGALVEYFAAHEALSRLAFIEIFDVGPGMIGRMTRSIEDFTKLLDELGPGGAARPARRARSDHGRDLGHRLDLLGARPCTRSYRDWSTS